MDRANLLDDMFSLADAGELEYNIVMDVCLYLTEEYQTLPWAVAKSKLMSMYTLLLSSSDTSVIHQMKAIYQSKHYKLLPELLRKSFSHVYNTFF